MSIVALSLSDESEDTARDRIDAIARTWIGTPFHDNACVKGAGVDCAQLIRGVFIEAGLVMPFETGHYSPQHFLHQSEERFLGFLDRFAREIPPPSPAPIAEKGSAGIRHGDVVLYRADKWKCFAHGAIVIKPGWPSIVHAHSASRVVRRGHGENPHLGAPIPK